MKKVFLGLVCLLGLVACGGGGGSASTGGGGSVSGVDMPSQVSAVTSN